MTDQTVLIIVAAIVPTIAAAGACAVSIITAFKSNKILEKADEIHTLTNSNLSKVSTALEVATAKMEQMQQQISAMDKAKVEADKLAMSQVANQPAPAAQQVAPALGSVEPVKMEIVNSAENPAKVKEQPGK